MTGEDQLPRMSGPKRWVRRVLVWLGGALAVLLGLMLVGAGYESASEAADARA